MILLYQNAQAVVRQAAQEHVPGEAERTLARELLDGRGWQPTPEPLAVLVAA